MKFNNNIKGSTKKRSIMKRLCGIDVASAIFITSMPAVIFETIPSAFLSVHAANKDDFTKYTDESKDITAASDGQDDGKYTISKPEDLITYSQYYYSFPQNHEGDILEIGFGEGVSRIAAEGFIALGTEDHPFKGKIISSAASSNILNLPESLFDYVADTAKIVTDDTENAEPSYIIISRSTNSANEPILARHVWHNPEAPETIGEGENAVPWIGNEWLVQVETYSDGTNAAKSNGYAGIIGEMQNGAKMQISVQDGTVANIVGTSDLGRICNNMGRDTMLTVNSIEGITTTDGESPRSNDNYEIATTSGNVGGIVGSMDNSSVLVMKCLPTNTSASITTESDGYAGGIVGKNDGGLVDITGLSGAYPVSGTITGSLGAGGLFGYARPLIDDPRTETVETSVTFKLTDYSIDANINGKGNIGGLFGELINQSLSITEAQVDDETGEITTPESSTDIAGGTIIVSGGTNTLTMSHSDGDADNIGGIAGVYNPYSANLTETLEISDVTVSVSNSGSYDNYGGGIGLIAETANTDDPAYVHFSNFNVTATGCGSTYFGGLVGKGDEAFVDANIVTVNASNFRGGAAVGCMARCVLKLSGTVNFSAALPCETNVDSVCEGQIVGYRDDTLIYYDGALTTDTVENGETVTTQNLILSSRKVDNIGTWGDILIFDGTNLKKSDVLTESNNHTITMTAPTIEEQATSVSSVADYAKLSLAMQIAYGNNPIITNETVSAPSTVTFGSSESNVNIDLSGTGLRGLTRDNKKNETDTKCTFTGTITGENNAAITLDVENIGGNPVYRHVYNGLVGIADTLSVSNLTFNGKMNLQPCETMYAGMAAATSKTSFTVNAVNTAANAQFTTNYVSGWGESALYLGRLVGNVSGNINVTGGTFDGSISGNATCESSCYGGVVGRISGQTQSGFSGVTISGSVANTGGNETQKIGGLIAEIVKGSGESRLNLDTVSVTGLTVSGNASKSCGGLLGYAWYNTNVQGTDVSSAENGMVINVSGTNETDTANKVAVTDGASEPTIKGNL